MADAGPLVSILVVSYNTRELLHRCLSSIEANVDPALAEVVVVDNASTDGSAELVETEHPSATLVRAPGNLGFAAGVNLAAAHARGRYLLLLNPDTEMHRHTVQALLDAHDRNPRAGIIGGRTLGPDGRVDARSCWDLPTPWSLFCFGTGLSTAFHGNRLLDPETLGGWARDSERQVGAVSGALLLVERGLWTELGGFDEDYFMYSEDIDLAARARRRGRTAVITPEAVVTHVVGAASANRADKMQLVMKGKATYVRKQWTGLGRRWGLAMLWCGAALRAALERVVGRRRAREPVWGPVWRARHDWLGGYDR